MQEILAATRPPQPTLGLSNDAAALVEKLAASLEKAAKPKPAPKPKTSADKEFAAAIEKLGDKLAERPSVVLPKLSLDERTDQTLDQILEAFHLLFRHTGIDTPTPKKPPPDV